MPKKYDVVAITGEYEKQGEKKLKYQNVGAVIEKDGKFYLKMDLLVVMHESGYPVNFFQLYTPKDRQGTQQEPAPPVGEFDDLIPF